MRDRHRRLAAALVLALALAAGGAAGAAVAQERPILSLAAEPPRVATRPTLNLYGVTGLIETPSAGMRREGDLALSFSGFGRFTRTTLTYQIFPWLEGSFRYSGTQGLAIGRFGPDDVYYDRSFDLRLRLLREGRWRPALTIGLQDFIGTGVSAAEYIVATKHLTPRLKVTAGLGWGRLGTIGSILTTGTRPPPGTPTGGTPNFDQWFRGPAAPFGGVQWQATDRLLLVAEYSSDAYELEARTQRLFDRRSSLNFGAQYELARGLTLGLYSLYGSQIAASVSLSVNTRERAGGDFLFGPGSPPVPVRPARAAAPQVWGTDWAADPPAAAARLRAPMAQALAAEGLALERLAVSADRAELRFRNLGFDATAQAIGRAARAMARVLPASVETFDLVPVATGIGTARVTLRRSDLETIEFVPDAAAALRARMVLSDAARPAPGGVFAEGAYPRFTWSLSPYLAVALFDPDNPYRFDVGLGLRAQVDLVPGLLAEASVGRKLFGILHEATRASDSVLPRVRSEANLYNRTDTFLGTMTLAWFARPSENLYSRVTLGYLERHFAGVSAELLWKPVASRLAFGAEVNYVAQRAFDGGLGLRDYRVATGHVSAYYAVTPTLHAQIDVGRYLAGDWGATLQLEREFANGWRVGAFATLTDVPFATFGEGSFDKGIVLRVPFAALLGTPQRAQFGAVIRPILRDGGARLMVDGRLYEKVRGDHGPALDASFGRVWR